MTKEQLSELCGTMAEHPESADMGLRFLDTIESEINLVDVCCNSRIAAWDSILTAMASGDTQELFQLLVGKSFDEVLKECCIIPSDTNKEAYIPIMPWQLSGNQKKNKFKIMNAIRFMEASRSAAERGKTNFECPLCGGDAKADFAPNGHLHGGCSRCGISFAE